MKIVTQVKSVSDYLTVIDELNKSYLSAPTDCKFIYRGISSTDYQLLPSVFRKSIDNDISICGPVENECYTSYAKEKQILQAFVGEACAYIKNDASKRMCMWAEYAQHYGVPTRFLDWTENPLVALYFACKGNKPDYHQAPIKHQDEEEWDIGGKDGVVWMLYVSHYRKFVNQVNNIIYGDDQKQSLTIEASIEKIYMGTEIFQLPIIYKPYYADLRMSAQSSYFMVWGKKKKPLDHFFSESNYMRSNKSSDGERCWGVIPMKW